MSIQLTIRPVTNSRDRTWASGRLRSCYTSFAFSACGTMPATEAPVGQLRPLDALLEVAALPER